MVEDFDFIDERVSTQILDDAARNWVKANPQMFEAFVDRTLDDNRRKWLAREKWPELVIAVANCKAKRLGCDTRSWSGLAAGIHRSVALKVTGGARIVSDMHRNAPIDAAIVGILDSVDVLI